MEETQGDYTLGHQVCVSEVSQRSLPEFNLLLPPPQPRLVSLSSDCGLLLFGARGARLVINIRSFVLIHVPPTKFAVILGSWGSHDGPRVVYAADDVLCGCARAERTQPANSLRAQQLATSKLQTCGRSISFLHSLCLELLRAPVSVAAFREVARCEELRQLLLLWGCITVFAVSCMTTRHIEKFILAPATAEYHKTVIVALSQSSLFAYTAFSFARKTP